jgi:phage/plasmid-like protein (TIGR03299 family)
MNEILQAFSGLTLQDPSKADQVAELLDRFDLRWSVSKQPLLLPDGTETPFLAVVREDTNHALTTCKDGYVPYQNSELAELLIRISEKTGFEIHSGGSFNGGGKVYLQLATNNSIKGIGENKTRVDGYVTGINGHDGTTSLKWGSTNITICCKNTFSAAKGKLKNSVRHTSSIHDRVSEALRDIEAVTRIEQTIFDTYIRLSERQVTKSNITKVVKSVTGVDIDNPRADELFSKISINKAGELTNSIANEIKQKGETLWGLFSGVTHYTTHKLSTPRRENARLESKYVGTGLDIDNRVYADILEM